MNRVIEFPRDDINREHRLARQSAESAVEHAIRCGQMLADVKAALPHGQFGRWVAEHCEFSGRAARAYMRAAARQSGNALPFSTLREALGWDAPEEPKQHAESTPTWLPAPGHIAAGTGPRGLLVACQESTAHPGYYDLLVVDPLDDGSATGTSTRRPIAGWGVGIMLDAAGIDQHVMSWTQSPVDAGAIRRWLP